MSDGLWIVVLIKDFDRAKQRLRPLLDARSRRRLAMRTARRAIRAARAVAPTLAVCGSEAAAAVAAAEGVVTVLESAPSGQNHAAEQGVRAATERGADSVLLLSSDLPLVTAHAIESLVRHDTSSVPALVAAAAQGRGGTNALLLRPPGGVVMRFGAGSRPRFALEAQRSGRAFTVHHDLRLALDLDEPEDVQAWLHHRGSV